MGSRPQNGEFNFLLLLLANTHVVLIIYTRHSSPQMFYRNSVDSQACMAGDGVGSRQKLRSKQCPGHPGPVVKMEDSIIEGVDLPMHSCWEDAHCVSRPWVSRAGRFTHCFA